MLYNTPCHKSRKYYSYFQHLAVYCGLVEVWDEMQHVTMKQPDVWQWVRNKQDLGFFGLKNFVMRWAQSRLAARSFAISM